MWPALIVLGTLMVFMLYGVHTILPGEVMIDCRLAEISPDYTTAMKEQCRKLRSVK